jgi:hypothetical protein
MSDISQAKTINKTDLEARIAQVLLDSKIRNMCRPYLKPWMLQRNIYRYLIETLLKQKFNDWELEKKVLGLHLLSI